eukprot:5690031-Prymnesium_polylepis.1
MLLEAFVPAVVSALVARKDEQFVARETPPSTLAGYDGDPKIYGTVEAVLCLVDWAAVAAKVGQTEVGCYKVTGRILRGRRTASDAAVRSRLAVSLLQALQTHSIDL